MQLPQEFAEPWLLHPAAVHYPIALLTTGLAAQVWFVWRRAPAWLTEAVSWLLWLGTASVWAALGLGLWAEDTAPHVPAAWETLAEHKELAFWTAGLFSALSIWRGRHRKNPSQNPRWELAFTLAWIVCAGVLVATAYHGGEVVFFFGMGVKP